MTLIACLSVYNEERMIRGALESVRDVAGRIVVVDGAYSGFPLIRESHASTDRTLEIAAEFGAEIIGYHGGPGIEAPPQEEKRNRYFIGGEGDWYLILDADERLQGQIDRGLLNRRGASAYTLSVSDPVFPLSSTWIRLIKHSPDLCYEGAHNAIFREGRLLRADATPCMRSARIAHEVRGDEDRRRAAGEYYQRQFEHERDFRIRNAYP